MDDDKSNNVARHTGQTTTSVPYDTSAGKQKRVSVCSTTMVTSYENNLSSSMKVHDGAIAQLDTEMNEILKINITQTHITKALQLIKQFGEKIYNKYIECTKMPHTALLAVRIKTEFITDPYFAFEF